MMKLQWLLGAVVHRTLVAATPDPDPAARARISTLVGAADVPLRLPRLFVGNIAFDATEADIGAAVAPFAELENLLVYVTFTAPDGADQLFDCLVHAPTEPDLRAFGSSASPRVPAGWRILSSTAAVSSAPRSRLATRSKSAWAVGRRHDRRRRRIGCFRTIVGRGLKADEEAQRECAECIFPSSFFTRIEVALPPTNNKWPTHPTDRAPRRASFVVFYIAPWAIHCIRRYCTSMDAARVNATQHNEICSCPSASVRTTATSHYGPTP
ncbi:hypothetical protein B0H13DRAFT_1863133 [Mycena leptocephala]|nr:hypothetical protein B0H13DRAFT_1863133 [Mycena leptocephala]